MCGRYRLSRRKQVVEEYFDSVSGEEEWSQRRSEFVNAPKVKLKNRIKVRSEYAESFII